MLTIQKIMSHWPSNFLHSAIRKKILQAPSYILLHASMSSHLVRKGPTLHIKKIGNKSSWSRSTLKMTSTTSTLVALCYYTRIGVIKIAIFKHSKSKFRTYTYYLNGAHNRLVLLCFASQGNYSALFERTKLPHKNGAHNKQLAPSWSIWN